MSTEYVAFTSVGGRRLWRMKPKKLNRVTFRCLPPYDDRFVRIKNANLIIGDEGIIICDTEDRERLLAK